MEKQRKIKILSVVALIVAVLGLTVAFAALSQTLTINGTANINTASWDIHFENLESGVGGDAVVNGEPVINRTTITGINVTLTKPNDIVQITADIVNAGTINAKIGSVEVSPLCEMGSPVESCDWDNDGEVTEEDIQKVNDNISFLVGYASTDSYVELKTNDTLNKNERSKIGILVGYIKVIKGDDLQIQESTELPKRDLQFNDLSVTINYVQA